MIQINLLPFREERKKKRVLHQMTGFLLFFLFTAGALFQLAFSMDRRIARMEEDTKKTVDHIGIYREKADKAGRMKKDLSLLDRKIAVIADLNQGRYRQVDLLAELARTIVEGRMWIDHITTDPLKVVIQGMAFENRVVADFLTRLETSSHYERIDLKQSVSRRSDQGRLLRAFTLECRKNPRWDLEWETGGSENGR